MDFLQEFFSWGGGYYLVRKADGSIGFVTADNGLSESITAQSAADHTAILVLLGMFLFLLLLFKR
jgi:hypothetical protein